MNPNPEHHQGRIQISWEIGEDNIQITYPPGHPVFPEGRTISSNQGALDRVTINGRDTVQPSIISPDLARIMESNPETVQRLIGIFESLARKVADQEEQEALVASLFNQMRPDDGTYIRLKGACGHELRIFGEIRVPMQEYVRVPYFAYGGIVYKNFDGESATYIMVTDDRGKFDYTPDGILYRRSY